MNSNWPKLIEQFRLSYLCILVEIESNRSKWFMYRLSCDFRFTDPIKLFRVVWFDFKCCWYWESKCWICKCRNDWCWNFSSFCFTCFYNYLFDPVVILINLILFICSNKSSCNKTYCKKLVLRKYLWFTLLQ